MQDRLGPYAPQPSSSIAQIENDCQFRTGTCLSKLPDGLRIRRVRKLNSIIYGFFGVLAMVYGLGALIRPQAIVPEAGQFPVSHLVREQGALAVFVGLMFLWCIFNEDRRTAVHYFLTLFAFLLAAIHWWDFFSGNLSWRSPLYNSVPFLILLLMALVNRVAAKI
jgi:hypothetical protein